MHEYIRKPLFDVLQKNLQGEPNLIQVITGPRQVGKTTLAVDIVDFRKERSCRMLSHQTVC